MNEIDSYLDKRKQDKELEILAKYPTGYGFFIAALDEKEKGNAELAERLYKRSLDTFINDLDKLGIDEAFFEDLGYEFLEDNILPLAKKYGLEKNLLDVAEKAYLQKIDKIEDYDGVMELKDIIVDIRNMKRNLK